MAIFLVLQPITRTTLDISPQPAAARRLGGHAKDIGDFEFADEMAAPALCIESHAREYPQ